jgi:hypothetical protein
MSLSSRYRNSNGISLSPWKKSQEIVQPDIFISNTLSDSATSACVRVRGKGMGRVRVRVRVRVVLLKGGGCTRLFIAE